jgi:copper chaperone CopZ
MIKKIYRVEGMHCPNCAMRLESIEDTLRGIRSVEASYRNGRMVVEYDESQVGESQILAAVEEAGYRAEPA